MWIIIFKMLLKFKNVIILSQKKRTLKVVVVKNIRKYLKNIQIFYKMLVNIQKYQKRESKNRKCEKYEILSKFKKL